MNTVFTDKILGWGLTYDDVILIPQYSEIRSRDDVDTSIDFVGKFKLRVPLTVSNYGTVITPGLCIKMAELGGIAFIHQFQSIDAQVEMLKEVKSSNMLAGAAIGATGEFLERAKALVKNGADVILIDSPHAHTAFVIEAVKAFKKLFPDMPLIAGTVATGQGCNDLINAGVNGIKLGVGAGGVCLTRINAGSGVPQITAILDSAQICRDNGITLIADAGIRNPGDLGKAIGAGADAIMSGSIYAGTDEAGGDLVEIEGKRFRTYAGDASEYAKKRRLEKDPNYRKNSTNYVEGDHGLVPCTGPIEGIVQKFEMGLRSAMSYSGAQSIKEFQLKAQFLQMTQSGIREAGSHAIARKL